MVEIRSQILTARGGFSPSTFARRFSDLLDRAELAAAVAGAGAVAFAALAGVVVMGFRIDAGRDPAGDLLGAVLLGGLLYGQIRAVLLLGSALEGYEYPRSVRVSLTMIDRPIWLRPVLAAWWSAEALTFYAGGHALVVEMTDMSAELTDPTLRVAGFVIGLVGGFGLIAAANTFLLSACAATTGSARLVWALHRIRLPLDLALTFGLAAAVRL